MNLRGYCSGRVFADHCRKQGLPEGFDLPGFTVTAKVAAVGNGVPLAMGRAVARAVMAAISASSAAPRDPSTRRCAPAQDEVGA